MVRDIIEFITLPVPVDIEAVWIKVAFKNRAIHISGMYRIPNSPLRILSTLRQFMESNMQRDDNIILFGDLNLRGIDSKAYSPGGTEISNCNEVLGLAFCFGLKQAETDYTRISDHASSILHLAFVSNHLLPFLIDCETPGRICDH